SDSKLATFLDSERGDSWGIRVGSSVTGVVWLDGGVDGGYEVDNYVWGDKDGEDVIRKRDNSGVVSMVGISGIFDISAGNPSRKILLKLNLPDHLLRLWL
ncbi:hypothetical protein Tco_1426570, partial [Tanacetum coccineum]